MKALVYHGAEDVRMEEIPTPVPQKGEVLLKVKACAICGTDVRIIKSGHRAVRPPLVTGHEVSGEVVKIGEGVQEVKVGDSVIVVTPVGCGNCFFCKKDMQNMCKIVSQDVHSIGYYCNGGFAEYLLLDKEAVANKNLIPYNAPISYEEAALTEPLSCVINGQQFLNIQKGEVVLIFGAGPIGCMHGLIARSSGAKVILSDVVDEKLELAKKTGSADFYINSEKEDLGVVIKKETDGRGVDVAITACASPEAQISAMKYTGIRGRISFFGGLPKDKNIIHFDSNDLHYAEKSVFGAFASSHPQYRQALEMISRRVVDARKLITHTFPLEDFQQALEVMKRGETLKVVITP